MAKTISKYEPISIYLHLTHDEMDSFTRFCLNQDNLTLVKRWNTDVFVAARVVCFRDTAEYTLRRVWLHAIERSEKWSEEKIGPDWRDKVAK